MTRSVSVTKSASPTWQHEQRGQHGDDVTCGKLRALASERVSANKSLAIAATRLRRAPHTFHATNKTGGDRQRSFSKRRAGNRKADRPTCFLGREPECRQSFFVGRVSKARVRMPRMRPPPFARGDESRRPAIARRGRTGTGSARCRQARRRYYHAGSPLVGEP